MSMRKLLDSEEKVKYSGFWAVIGMFWAFSAQAQMPYMDEVKALAERTADRVDVIHSVVAQHSATITELKQAK